MNRDFGMTCMRKNSRKIGKLEWYLLNSKQPQALSVTYTRTIQNILREKNSKEEEERKK